LATLPRNMNPQFPSIAYQRLFELNLSFLRILYLAAKTLWGCHLRANRSSAANQKPARFPMVVRSNPDTSH